MPTLSLLLPVCVLPRAQADHVPLEDELEALCCLHAARAEVILSGDVEVFLERASMVEAFSFREEEEDADTEDEVMVDVPPSTSTSLSRGDGDGRCPLDGPGQAGVDRDGPRRRLAALENCLDAFERLGSIFVAIFITQELFIVKFPGFCVFLFRP